MPVWLGTLIILCTLGSFQIWEEEAMAKQGEEESREKDETASHPGLQPSQSGLQPSNPSLQPSYPGLQPSNPGLQPSHPGLQPSQSGLQPSHPSLQPSHPGLEELPPEILLCILHHLPFDSVVKLSSVSRGLHTVAQDETLWRGLFLKNYDWRTPGQLCIEDGRSWKERFKEEYLKVYIHPLDYDQH